MGLPPSTTPDPPPLLYHKPPLLRRIRFCIQLWALKLFSSFVFSLLRIIRPGPPNTRPTITKTYPCRPQLRHRFFIPGGKTQYQYTKASASTLQNNVNKRNGVKLYPLYINIHGGGFSLCDAQFDDIFCGPFSEKYQLLVANLSYSMTPSSRFPTSLNDIIASIHAIIHDSSLPIDHTRICLGGFSAGGNLALAAAQHKSLQGIIHAVASWYPVTDMTLSPAEKQATRKYRSVFDTDDFPNWGPVWNWAYFDSGLNMRDPRVGVKWSKREDLPEWICVLGTEYDMLCKEARDMVEGWVGEKERRRVRSEMGEGWEVDGGRTKWLLKWDVRHGFTHAFTAGWSLSAQRTSRRAREEAEKEIVEWLWRGAWGKGRKL